MSSESQQTKQHAAHNQEQSHQPGPRKFGKDLTNFVESEQSGMDSIRQVSPENLLKEIQATLEQLKKSQGQGLGKVADQIGSRPPAQFCKGKTPLRLQNGSPGRRLARQNGKQGKMGAAEARISKKVSITELNPVQRLNPGFQPFGFSGACGDTS